MERISPIFAQRRPEDQKAFDRLSDGAKFHTHAAVSMSHPWPMETILLSICLKHEKILAEIQLKRRKVP